MKLPLTTAYVVQILQYLNSITSRFTHCSNTSKSIEVNTIANLGHSSFVSERFIAINYYKKAPRATASRWFILIKLRDR